MSTVLEDDLNLVNVHRTARCPLVRLMSTVLQDDLRMVNVYRTTR